MHAKGNVGVFERNNTPLETIYKKNIAYAKGILRKRSFAPVMFVITKEHIYYVALVTKDTDENKVSPLDYVIPVLTKFLAHEDESGEVLAYQVIAEAWMGKMSSGSVPKYQHGDLSRLPSRTEVLINTVMEKGKQRFCEIYTMTRGENTDNVVSIRKDRFFTDKATQVETPKTPPIPTTDKMNAMKKEFIKNFGNDNER